MRPFRIASAFALLLAGGLALQACDEAGIGTDPEPESFTLTVTIEGVGGGGVSSDPAGITCDHTGGSCSAEYEEGTAVTLTATPGADSEFAGWAGDGSGADTRVVEMSAARSVTAEFDNPDLAVQTIGADGGQISSRDGEVTLLFPAGALTGDEDITIERLDPAELGEEWATLRDADDIAGAYEMGPDGLTFDVPVEVQIGTQPAEILGDTMIRAQTPVVATVVSDTVSRLRRETSVDAGTGETEATVFMEHFSPFVQRVRTVTVTLDRPASVQVGEVGTITATAESAIPLTNEYADVYASTVTVMDGPGFSAGTSGGRQEVSAPIFCTGIGTVTLQLKAVFGSGENTAIFVFLVECEGSRLTVTTSGEGTGTVTGPDFDGLEGGVNCGSQGSDCTEDYGTGESVTLTATPDEGSYLAGWTVNGQEVPDDGTGELTLTMNDNTTVDARFEPITEEELTVTLDGAGDGTVTSSPAGIDCTKTGDSVTGTCSAPFDRESSVELTGTTPDGSTVTDWSGDGTTTDIGTRIVQMATAAAVGMTFPNVPSTTTLLDLAALGYYYLESITFATTLFPFMQPSSDAGGGMMASSTGEACPTALLAADGGVVAVDACDGSLVQSYDFDFTFYNAWALPRPESETTGDHAIVATGQNYAFFWVDDTGAVTSQIGQLNWGNVPDATAIGGDPANGLAVVRDEGNGTTIRFVRYDPAKGYHDFLTNFVGVTHTPPNLQTVFANGVPTDPAALPEEMLAVGSNGTNGVLYYIETISETDPVHTEIGTLNGDNPRRIRCDLESGICAVSDFANSLVNVILWSGTGTPTIAGTTTGGSIAQGPVGLDVYGNYIVTAGYSDNQYSIIEVDGSGNVVNTTTTALPAGCSQPGHARFLRDGSNTVLVSCNGSQAIARIPNAF